jgi:hypothetical protein
MTGVLGSTPTATAQTAPVPSATDITTVKAILNNEYMEAEFYLRIAYGTGLSAEDTSGAGPAGPVIAPQDGEVKFNSAALKAIATSLANDELAHVRGARATLISFGVQPPARPTINLQESWRTLGELAGIGNDFNPFLNEKHFLLAAYYFEENASQVLKGVIEQTLFQPLQSAAAGLLGDEAYHGGYVRLALVVAGEFERTNQIAALRNRLIDRPVPTDPGLGTHSAPILAPVDANAMIFDRTGREQLNVLYLGVNANAGGFFPNGVNLA